LSPSSSSRSRSARALIAPTSPRVEGVGHLPEPRLPPCERSARRVRDPDPCPLRPPAPVGRGPAASSGRAWPRRRMGRWVSFGSEYDLGTIVFVEVERVTTQQLEVAISCRLHRSSARWSPRSRQLSHCPHP
jgi:hypothetical protein